MVVSFSVFDHLDDDGGDPAQIYAKRLLLAEACDAAGFRAWHVAEHHGTPHGLAPSPNLFLAALAQRTRRLRLGPLVMLLPLYHPLRAAAEVCMLDQISGGRLELGVGRGTSAIELGFFGLPIEKSRDLFSESLEILLQAMRTDQLSYMGDTHRLRDVSFGLRPRQWPHPPLWYGTNRQDSAVWAAERGMNLVCFGHAAAIGDVTDAYRRHARAAAPLLGMTRHIVVAESDDAARELAAPAYARWFASLVHLEKQRGLAWAPKLPPSLALAEEFGVCVVGSASTVREILLRQMREAGVNNLLCQIAFGDLPLEAALATVAALRDEIIPAFAENHRHDARRLAQH
jgi:alkanesulfonate monooxygenase SsuD/methylene tetrahydromethanopterin reductase-like flavin-dependent oxidoreductase (luciferase family)